MLNYIKSKLRKGFEKYLDKTLQYFELQQYEITEEQAENIIKFINGQNSKLNKSYYILLHLLKYNDKEPDEIFEMRLMESHLVDKYDSIVNA